MLCNMRRYFKNDVAMQLLQQIFTPLHTFSLLYLCMEMKIMNSLMPSGLFRNGHFDFSRLLESAWFSPRKTDDFDGLSKECLSDCLQIFGVFDNFIGRTDFGTTDFTTVNGVSISRIQMRRDMQLI
ncbi:MAG: hypothetical protein IJ523_12385, partial [Succinivibrionaceae bacterium]|nr:hypothetical protein [Succinivibrionaceae bacterium]